MYVYFKFNGETFVVPDVKLKDGYLPMVDNVGGDLQFIEPGIWFKTLIVDSVSVDCDFKILQWIKSNDSLCPLSPDERASMSPKKQLEVLGLKDCSGSSQCMEFDSEVDDLFDTARNFFENKQILPVGASVCLTVKPEVEDHPPTRFNQEILRLVHCYILPSINLNLDDAQSLKTALRCIEICLKNAETEILQKDKAISLTENSLRKQRESFLKDPNFERESYIRECSVDFLTSFLAHLEKDIQQEAEQMQKYQSQVNELRDKQGDHVQEQLDKARKARDKIHKVLTAMQMMRENIKNVVVRQQVPPRKRRSRKVSVKVFHEIYLEITVRLRSEKENIHKLILRKVKIASVREAICLAQEELATVGHSMGWQSLYDGTCSSTDVGILSTKPKEWATIGERVSSIINSGDTQHRYRHFCDNLTQKIEGSMGEASFFVQLSENDVQYPECEGFVNICTGTDSMPDINANKDKRLIFPDFQSLPVMKYQVDKKLPVEGGVYHPNTLPLHSLMDAVKFEVKKHMEEMCKRIIYILGQEDQRENSNTRQFSKKNSKDTYKNVWLCYESHLYERISVKLNMLYESRYRKKSRNLAEKLVGVSLQELGIDDPWLAIVAEPEDWENTQLKVPLDDTDSVELRSSRNSRNRRQDKRKTLSNSLGNMSIEKLYQCADRELKDMDGFEDFSFSLADEDDTERDMCRQQKELQRNETDMMGPPSYEDASAMSVDEASGFSHLPSYDEAFVMPGGPETSTMLRTKPESQYNPSVRNGQVLPTCGGMQSLSSEESIRRFSSNIDEVIKVAPINLKVKNITKAFKFVATEVSKLKVAASPPGGVYQPCADDMLTVIIVMLTQLESEMFTKLFAHLNMILDLMPPFMNGSEHDCALMNFHIAFQYLFDRHVLNQSRSSRELDL
ncbi:uncharacterized protein LOC110441652 [Mizuhopecten yessoensis]|uniref:VPS9 domain-containing protein n=1 Tax=Mizuhopecten yessoensis TaxID=6573 RepID=A0A210R1D6_MIZYE|nr:uncharacterized protein LOC110441652 [Mizuhopecten yessoensis]OWF54705.1 hypothetical protein KP79_PYT04208 [Mizuhopecten yessoensis]